VPGGSEWGVTTEPLKTGEDAAVSLLVFGDGAPVVVPLSQGVDVRIGRAPTADVVIEDTSLSRHHAQFRLVDGGVEVEDLGSSNGTVVRGVTIVPNKPYRLEIGETATLGAVLVVVQQRTGTAAERKLPVAPASDELIARIAASNISVLILGETGVGKEVMADRLHALSPRRDAPLVKLNCAALMASVLESELFGHERGSYTGAVKEKPGLIESADGGTLFLDEVGETDPGLQVKLLRVLETRETQRIGALRPKIVDVRIVAATNRTPAELIQAGLLRADFYHRLAGFTITIPPLRERRAQISSLASELLARHAGASLTLRPDAVARLVRHDWPGNVRELRNVLDRAVVLANGPEIGLSEIELALQLEPAAELAARPSSAPGAAPARGPVPPRATSEPAPTREPPPPPETATDPERARILAVLDECGGNQSIAAEKLGMSRRALVYRLQAWGMTRPRRR
jgi:two-component system, NtrC family, response regulator AtoC